MKYLKKLKEKRELNQVLQNNKRNLKKLIFLDLDGVLFTGRHAHHLYNASRKNLMQKEVDVDPELYYTCFDPLAVENLTEIIGETQAHIVITSTYRKHGHPDRIQKLWKKLELPGIVIGSTPVLDITLSPTFGGNFSNWSKSDYKPNRSIEILAWLEHYKNFNISPNARYTTSDMLNAGIGGIVVIDDDYIDSSLLSNNFVQVDSQYGITHQDAKKCINILNKMQIGPWNIEV